MNKRIYSIWGVGGLIFSVLICAGCGGKEETDSVDGTQSKIVQPDPKPEEMPVTPAGKVALAIEYYTGEGRTVDYSKAANLFRQAANNGSSEAQFALGCMYQNGHGVTQNFMEAADWYLKSAQADNPECPVLARPILQGRQRRASRSHGILQMDLSRRGSRQHPAYRGSTGIGTILYPHHDCRRSPPGGSIPHVSGRTELARQFCRECRDIIYATTPRTTTLRLKRCPKFGVFRQTRMRSQVRP